MPSSCLICNKIIGDGYICSEHFNQLTFITSPKCKICSNPFEYHVDGIEICVSCLAKKPLYDSSVVVFAYDEFSKKLIFDFKYKDKIFLSKFFSGLIISRVGEIKSDIDFITPVALHKKRIRKRKYNHSALLAKDISKFINKKVIYDLLIRQINTRPQSSLGRSSRKRNVKGAFKFNKKYKNLIYGKNIAIVDDVITSGATIEEYCKILRKYKVGKIYILSLCKTIID